MLVVVVLRTVLSVLCPVAYAVQRAVSVVVLCLCSAFVIKTLMSRSLRVSASPSTAVPLPAVSWADLEEEMAELPAQPSLSLKTSLPDSPDGRSSQARSLRATCTERHPRDSATCAVPHGLLATCSDQETPYSTRDVRRKPERFKLHVSLQHIRTLTT